MILSDTNLLREIVLDNQSRIAAFESFGIDCNINSELTLFEVCENRIIDTKLFVEIIEAIDSMKFFEQQSVLN